MDTLGCNIPDFYVWFQVAFFISYCSLLIVFDSDSPSLLDLTELNELDDLCCNRLMFAFLTILCFSFGRCDGYEVTFWSCNWGRCSVV